MITVLVSAAELDAPEVAIAGDAYRHLFRARRVAVGERLRLTDGAGGEVTAVDRAAGTVRLADPAPLHPAAGRVELLVAAPEKARASWLVEKATELGVAAVRFLDTARTPRDFGAGTLDRLERVAAAAVEQSHGSRLPELSGAHAWGELPLLLSPFAAGARYALDTGGRALSGADLALDPGGTAVLVGPEGGWTEEERAAFAELSCRPLTLGPMTLRTETAALAAAVLALMSSEQACRRMPMKSD